MSNTATSKLEDDFPCYNKVSLSFDGLSFLDDYRTYTLDSNKLGCDYCGLEYGDQNIWNTVNNNSICDLISWEITLTFGDLLNGYKGITSCANTF